MFKVGEKVRVVVPKEFIADSDFSALDGKIGVVVGTNGYNMLVRVDGVPSNFRNSDEHKLEMEWFRKTSKLERVLK